jgi:hypothetical protein
VVIKKSIGQTLKKHEKFGERTQLNTGGNIEKVLK